MASTATDPVLELVKKNLGERRRRDWLPILLSVAVQLGTFLFIYGRLTERVDNVREDVRELRQEVLQIKAR